jgi:hypothetical protein
LALDWMIGPLHIPQLYLIFVIILLLLLLLVVVVVVVVVVVMVAILLLLSSSSSFLCKSGYCNLHWPSSASLKGKGKGKVVPVLN